MKTTPMTELLARQHVLEEFDDHDLDLFAGCAQNLVVHVGDFLAREGMPADALYVVRQGRVGIEVQAPGEPLLIETVGAGDVVGWSWIFPPHRWAYDLEVLETAHVVAIDGACLRAKCDADPAFGYRVMQHFAQVIVHRLQATRLRLLDLYGKPA